MSSYSLYNCTKILLPSIYWQNCSQSLVKAVGGRILAPSYVCCKNITVISDIVANNLAKDKWNCSFLLCNDLKQYYGTNETTHTTLGNLIIPLLISLIVLLIVGILVGVWMLKKERSYNNVMAVNDEYMTLRHVLPEIENTQNESAETRMTVNDEYTTLSHVFPEIANAQSESPEMIMYNHIQQLVRELHSQDWAMTNFQLTMKEQANAILYDPKLELARRHFKIKQKLGSGNFGKVYKGEIVGLFYPGSKTTVAIKTINDRSSLDDVTSLFCEIIILSNLSLHCNLVNMLGACTSNAEVDGNIFVLLEFCEKGDIKDYLIKNRNQFVNSFSESNSPRPINSRLFIQWAYDIAMGMAYLAEKRIMHGDLTTRNVLLGGGCQNKENNLTAKVADFGLSKQMTQDSYYKKMKKGLVPWKWTAFEYLENGEFEMKSDVWSYGVVIWEIFSLGKEPYSGCSLCDVLEMLKRGDHLPCPEDVEKISSWPATQVYEELAQKCFHLQVNHRASFSDLVYFIKTKLNDDELKCYDDVTNECNRQNALLLDDNTRDRLKSTTGRSPRLRRSTRLKMGLHDLIHTTQ